MVTEFVFFNTLFVNSKKFTLLYCC